MAEILSKQPVPSGPNLMIVTNGGGPAVIAIDELAAHGGQLATIGHDAMKVYNDSTID